MNAAPDYARILRILADAIDRGQLRGEEIEVRVDRDTYEVTGFSDAARRFTSGAALGTVIVAIKGPLTAIHEANSKAALPPRQQLLPR